MKGFIQKLILKQSLTSEEVQLAVNGVLKGQNVVQTAAFLALLQAKGETADELLGFVKALRAHAKKIQIDRPTLDIVGTGGDLAGTVNISTGSAILASRCGVPIIKQGNRSVTSLCGSADVLEQMGYNIHMSEEEIQKSVEKRGFAFCFAPDYHPMLKGVRSIRNELKIPTAFNLIGPLLNPAGTDHLQIGVFKKEHVPIIGEVLFKLGTKRSLVFHGGGIDELSCLGAIEAILVTSDKIEKITIDPEKLGLKKCTLEDLKGGDAKTNANLLREALSGKMSPFSDTLILNAAVALFLYGKTSSIAEGIQQVKNRLYKKSLKKAIHSTKRAVIAEIKRASPSKGKIGDIPDVRERANQYIIQGATAISILTSERFDATLADLKNLGTLPVPILRKDFLLSFDDIHQSHDADLILLIVAFLGERTKEMLDEAKRNGFEAIVEVHNKEELQIALDAGAEIIGVNQRNLHDFTMDKGVYKELIEHIPQGVVKIAESGIATPSDADHVFGLGYDAILVGEALTRGMRVSDVR